MKYHDKQLTKRETEVLDYIIAYHDNYGMSPTITEIAEGLYTSRTYVRNAVYELMDKGYIKYTNLKRRSIVIDTRTDVKI